jgi:UDP-N-acetylglucosamine 2-epimerase (non-hydrolysing)
MKVAPLLRELHKHPDTFQAKLVHTGQHFNAQMSDVFFSDLGLPSPHKHLGVGAGSHAEQTAKIMVAFEKVCHLEQPDLVLVVGDVNSTMACAITAKKLCIPVAHVEAGLRSRDWSMPEEINRIVTDAISDLLFTPSRDADENLLKEGIPLERIYFVGNVMIDCLLAQLPKSASRATLSRLQVRPGNYATLTLHRPSNVDHSEILSGILGVMLELSQKLPIIWPVHPRSRKMLDQMEMVQHQLANNPDFRLIEPVGYLDMLALNRHARIIITDSGGLQEEATILGVPCVTIRNNTERPATIKAGANRLVGNVPAQIRSALSSVLNGNGHIRIPELWDGKASVRIVEVLRNHFQYCSPSTHCPPNAPV